MRKMTHTKEDLAATLVMTFLLLVVLAAPAAGQQSSEEELAKQSQNPIADLISVPLQSNFNFGAGFHHNKMIYVLNVQPVIPFNLSEEWNLITRIIMPVINQPNLSPSFGGMVPSTTGTGFGDFNPSFFFSPAKPGEVIWGVGPTFTLPTLVVLFFQIRPSNERDWQPEVAVTPHAEINGDLVTIRGVRNFDYRTESEFTPRWKTRTYDLRKLDSADIIAVYWAGKAIAHVMLSFGFEGKDYLAVSIETRKEKGEGYSTLAGFFRNYELYYVVADERDVIRVRTTYRQPQEDVYIYRVRGRLENLRRVFLDYLRAINDLHERPAFYNTLTTNCTTSILLHTRMNPESPPLSWKILLSGYLPEYLYDLGRLDTTKPFPELERLSHVNARAHASDKDPAFSQQIREGLPKPVPMP